MMLLKYRKLCKDPKIKVRFSSNGRWKKENRKFQYSAEQNNGELFAQKTAFFVIQFRKNSGISIKHQGNMSQISPEIVGTDVK